jgi:hypothetical protein
MGMAICKVAATGLSFCVLLLAGSETPRFEDYPVSVDWHGPVAEIKLVTPSERMFRSRLTEGAQGPANFAGHYSVTYWGCGGSCSAGAVIDLRSGRVYPPPLAHNGEGWEHWISCPRAFDDRGDEFRVNSRLMIVHCASSVYYMLWGGNTFRELLHGKNPG